MSAFTYILAAPGYGVPRAYTRGISIRTNGIIGLVWSGNVIEYTDTGGVFWQLALYENFFNWSSNYYTLDHVMDATHSHAWLGGVEQVAGAIVEYGYPPGAHELHIRLQASVILGADHTLLLPGAPAGFWYPISP